MTRPPLTSREMWANLCACSTQDKKLQKVMNDVGINREDAGIFLEVLAEMHTIREDGSACPLK